ncbi:MAG TPA: response regulator [Sphingomicrobium sp.]|nr:response regulator [Sphingomicrobium sp.]
MLTDKSILIVEDNVYLALDLSQAVEDMHGQVVGPVGTVAEALDLLKDRPIAGAVLDSQLSDRDVTPVVLVLVAKGVPFVIYTATGLPPGVARLHPDTPLLVQPLHAEAIVTGLLGEMRRGQRANIKAHG